MGSCLSELIATNCMPFCFYALLESAEAPGCSISDNGCSLMILLPIETTVKSFFGMFAIYSGEKLLLILRERDNQPGLNRIWIATARGGQESLKKALPALRTVSGAAILARLGYG
jgi:hypothetical protein